MTLREEKKLWLAGFGWVVGLDEAGRGGLAGPVVAAAVLVKQKNKRTKELKNLGINDSKKLSPKKREGLYEILISHSAIEWGLGWVSARVIDQINILEATRLAMQRAVRSLQKKLDEEIDFLILDGNFDLRIRKLDHLAQKSIIRADEKIFSCAAASIISKVRRDRMMKNYHQRYPCYGFVQHQGYATFLHCERLKKYGPCAVHRKSFRPVSSALNRLKK